MTLATSIAVADGLNHVTLRCTAASLPALRAFYIESLGLLEGARPAFGFPGHWLYSQGRPIVHLAALLDEPSAPSTGPLDHISFSASDLDGTRQRLKAGAISFDEAPVPGWPLHQIFLTDPVGLRIELTFDISDARHD